MKRRKKKLTDRHKTREVDKKIDIGANFILYTGKALHKKKKTYELGRSSIFGHNGKKVIRDIIRNVINVCH